MIKRLLLVWASNTAAIYIAGLLIDGVHVDRGAWRVIIAGAIFGFVNWLVKPVVTLLALPVIVLTLGIALFFVNLLMLYITDWVMPDFHIDSFGAAVGATIVIWLVNMVLYGVFGLDERKRSKSRS